MPSSRCSPPPPRRPRRTPGFLGTGHDPGVAVDRAGTAHVAWFTEPAGGAPVLEYCQVPRRERACTVRHTFALEEDGTAKAQVLVPRPGHGRARGAAVQRAQRDPHVGRRRRDVRGRADRRAADDRADGVRARRGRLDDLQHRPGALRRVRPQRRRPGGAAGAVRRRHREPRDQPRAVRRGLRRVPLRRRHPLGALERRRRPEPPAELGRGPATGQRPHDRRGRRRARGHVRRLRRPPRRAVRHLRPQAAQQRPVRAGQADQPRGPVVARA